jgi:hypothetical protein
LKLPTSGPPKFVQASGLAETQAALEGDLEMIQVAEGLFAYCDEEGKVKGLPVNRAANLLTRLCDTGLRSDDIVVGPLLLYGGHDADGNDLDFLPAWEKFVRAVHALPVGPKPW